jgi:hypothetical protein
MNLGPEAAAAAANRLIVLAASPVDFFAPPARGWARTPVESRINRPTSGSQNSSAMAAKTARLWPSGRSGATGCSSGPAAGAGRARPPLCGRSTHRINKLPVVAGDAAVLVRPARQQALDATVVGIRNLVAAQRARPSWANSEGRLLPKLPACCPHDLINCLISRSFAGEPCQ